MALLLSLSPSLPQQCRCWDQRASARLGDDERIGLDGHHADGHCGVGGPEGSDLGGFEYCDGGSPAGQEIRRPQNFLYLYLTVLNTQLLFLFLVKVGTTTLLPTLPTLQYH